MRTLFKIRVTSRNEDHVHCSVFEAEDRGGTYTYAKNGDLVFSPDAFEGFVESLERGHSNAVQVEVVR